MKEREKKARERDNLKRGIRKKMKKGKRKEIER